MSVQMCYRVKDDIKISKIHYISNDRHSVCLGVLVVLNF